MSKRNENSNRRLVTIRRSSLGPSVWGRPWAAESRQQTRETLKHVRLERGPLWLPRPLAKKGSMVANFICNLFPEWKITTNNNSNLGKLQPCNLPWLPAPVSCAQEAWNRSAECVSIFLLTSSWQSLCKPLQTSSQDGSTLEALTQ